MVIVLYVMNEMGMSAGEKYFVASVADVLADDSHFVD